MTLCDLSGEEEQRLDMTNTMGCLVDNAGDGLSSLVVADWELDFEILNVRVGILITWLSQQQL